MKNLYRDELLKELKEQREQSEAVDLKEEILAGIMFVLVIVVMFLFVIIS